VLLNDAPEGSPAALKRTGKPLGSEADTVNSPVLGAVMLGCAGTVSTGALLGRTTNVPPAQLLPADAVISTVCVNFVSLGLASIKIFD
jgi:hypothetical protein